MKSTEFAVKLTSNPLRIPPSGVVHFDSTLGGTF